MHSERVSSDDVFAVDTSEARPQDGRATRNHLEDLLGLRGMVTRLSRRLHDLEVQTEESLQKQRKDLLKTAATAVGIVDELRLLVLDARGSFSMGDEVEGLPASPSPPGRKGLRRWLGIGGVTPAAGERVPSEAIEDWLNVFQRLVSSAVGRLVENGAHCVPLLGQDVRTLEYEGRLVKRWVSVKNHPRGDALIVTKELCGLWVRGKGKDLSLIQRGEVMVRE